VIAYEDFVEGLAVYVETSSRQHASAEGRAYGSGGVEEVKVDVLWKCCWGLLVGSRAIRLLGWRADVDKLGMEYTETPRTDLFSDI
jgi:hypothetical protein